jgi:hypothetical protein
MSDATKAPAIHSDDATRKSAANAIVDTLYALVNRMPDNTKSDHDQITLDCVSAIIANSHNANKRAVRAK